jgi:hypothetical protein
MQTVLRVDPVLGNIYTPKAFKLSLSLPGYKTRRAEEGERGIFVSSVQRPMFEDDGVTLKRLETIWGDVSHNIRSNKGATLSVNKLFGTVGTAPAGVLSALAIASANITVTDTDLSLGSITQSVTTNEFTTIGLSRTTATIQNYVAASAGGTYSVDAYKSFSVSGSGTAYGAGLFDSTTVAGSWLYAEALFGTSASLINGDTLNVTGTVSN